VVVQRVSLWRGLRVLREVEWDSLLPVGRCGICFRGLTLLVQSGLFSAEGAFADTEQAAPSPLILL
jgi:hypothetical protein